MSKVKFRHLIDAGEIGSGTIKFKNYADVNAWRISDNINPRATRLVLGVYNVVNGEIGTLAKSDTMKIQPGMIIPTPDTSAMTDGVKFIGWLDDGTFNASNLSEITYGDGINPLSDRYGAVWQSDTYASKDDVPLSMVIDETAKAFATVKFNFASVPEGTAKIYVDVSGYYPSAYDALNTRIVDAAAGKFTITTDLTSWTTTMFALKSGTTQVGLGFAFRAYDIDGNELGATEQIKVESVSTETATEVQAIFLAKLATPQNVTANGTTVSWDPVENATGYDVLADGTSIGEVNS